MQEHCGCLEFTPIVPRLNCFEKGHMRRKGSFDFHMPVIAKETTSLVFTYSACLQFWSSDKWHHAAASSNKEGWRRLLDNLMCLKHQYSFCRTVKLQVGFVWVSRVLCWLQMGYLEFRNGKKKGSSLNLSKLRCSLEVSWVVVMAIFWHLCGYLEPNFLMPIYMCLYSLCKIYFSFQVHACLFFGICISGTEYPWYVVISKVLGFELWVYRTFPIFWLLKKLESVTSYYWSGLKISTNVWNFVRGLKQNFFEIVCANLNLTRGKCIVIRLISAQREKKV